MNLERYRVKPGRKIRLDDWSNNDTDRYDGRKKDGKLELEQMAARLAELQMLLFADGRHKLLVVLQGMDSSGKDGTVKHVFRQVNPLGVRVANFKRPNDVELAHDYLWRVHEHTPRNGSIRIWNRSHYEDVLVVRVHDLVEPTVWKRRYGHIREFERMLADEGTTILKLFLHISKDEQKSRLQERLDNPRKQWKFEHGDISERTLWDDYQHAYEQAIAETSTDYAPWYIIPSDKKWHRNLLVSQLLVETLGRLDLRYPDPAPDLDTIVIK